MTARSYILSNWKICNRQSRSGALRIHLFGKVFGHPRFAAGELISTSTITSYRFDTDSVLTRNGSEYRLGKADAADPAAKERLIALLDASQPPDMTLLNETRQMPSARPRA